ncbi:hypothetical protein Q5P01_000160 [Channa striata]|uniref:Uncharacterized protein n=1 Tax=Channa striata TaxID=64152 RepID=A0AA88IFU1_CHASR|nr:hypothetical protein Q5P01_000160 [Channa striata]
MLSQFEREPNIVVLNLERDLKDALPKVMYQENYSADLNLMDYLRLGVIKQAYNVLAVLRDAALARGKVAYARALAGNGGNAIIYSDIDITWNDRVPNVLAHRGMCSAPSLSRIFSFQHVCFRASKDNAPRLSDRVLAKAKEHSAMFGSNSRESRMRLFEYVRSGEAHATVKELVRDIQAVQPKAYRYTVQICTGENSWLYVHLDSIPLFRETVDDASLIVDFHSMSAPNPDPRRVENHTSIFMQLLPFMAMGEDTTCARRSPSTRSHRLHPKPSSDAMSDASFWGNRKDDRDFLEKCKHDIAERHTFVEGLLDYWEGMMLPEAPRYEHGSTNPVRYMHEMVALCLATEDYARSFLVILKTVNPCLFEDLVERGPQGKMVRKEPPPRMHLTAKVKSVLREQGVEEEVLHQCILNPENHGRIASSSIMSALDVLIQHDLILPEETYEVTRPMGKGNPDEACRFLRSLCESPGVGDETRRFVGLVVASYNMHIFGPAFRRFVNPESTRARL